MEDSQSNILVLLVDLNSLWWGQQILKHPREVKLSSIVDALLVFCNSFLMTNATNKLAVIALLGHSSKFVYPKADEVEEKYVVEDADGRVIGTGDGQYEVFTRVDSAIRESVKDLLEDPRREISQDTKYAGALGQGLCYINRARVEAGINKLQARLLVVKGSADNTSQYMGFMNAVFTAQKQNVVIDACILDNESTLLQQACDITNGVYLKIPQLSGLLQYLLWIFLPDPTTRAMFALPSPQHIDYRAACLCHHSLVDVGFVCSVCLSVYCSFTPVCTTCKATFRFTGFQKPIPKKKK